MRRRRAPAEDKRLDREHQRRGFGEYPKAHRAGKKQRRKRAAKGAVKSATRVALARAPSELGDPGFDPGKLEPRPVHAIWSTPLAIWVPRQLASRVARIGWNYFKRAYLSARDRAPFTAFLESLMKGRGGDSVLIAAELGTSVAWLDAQRLPARKRPPSRGDSRAEWLAAYFRDEPRAEARLRAWIRRLT